MLARSGARVALADKAAFPRDKACGDLVGPRGVQVLADLGLRIPDAGSGSDLLVVGPSGRRSRLPAFTGRTYPGHGIIVPRRALDHALREAALEAGALGVRARITAVERSADGRVDAVISSDGQRLAGEVIIAADGALSPVARLAGMLDPQAARWGFAIRAYVPAEVPLPLLVLLDASPWHIYPGYGWLFPGEEGRANVGIGVGLPAGRGPAPLRDDLARLVALLRQRGDLSGDARPGPVMGGWLRMGGAGTPPAAGNVLLAGDAAGLINPLQGEGIGPAMISGRLAAEAVLAGPAQAGTAYTEAIETAFGRYIAARLPCRPRCWPGRGPRRRPCGCSPRRPSGALRRAPGRSTGTTWPTARGPALPPGPRAPCRTCSPRAAGAGRPVAAAAGRYPRYPAQSSQSPIRSRCQSGGPRYSYKLREACV